MLFKKLLINKMKPDKHRYINGILILRQFLLYHNPINHFSRKSLFLYMKESSKVRILPKRDSNRHPGGREDFTRLCYFTFPEGPRDFAIYNCKLKFIFIYFSNFLHQNAVKITRWVILYSLKFKTEYRL